MPETERQILVMSEDGTRVLFHCERARMEVADDGTVTITDLTVGPPAWVRIAQSNLRLHEAHLQMLDR